MIQKKLYKLHKWFANTAVEILNASQEKINL